MTQKIRTINLNHFHTQMETKITSTSIITTRTATSDNAEYRLTVEHKAGQLMQFTAEVRRLERGTSPTGEATVILAEVGRISWRANAITLSAFPLTPSTTTYITEIYDIAESLKSEPASSANKT